VLASITWPVTQRTSQLSSLFKDDKKEGWIRWPPAAHWRNAQGEDRTKPFSLEIPIAKYPRDCQGPLVCSERWLFVPATAKHLSTILARCPHFKREKKGRRVGWCLVASLYIDRPEHRYETRLLEKKEEKTNRSRRKGHIKCHGRTGHMWRLYIKGHELESVKNRPYPSNNNDFQIFLSFFPPLFLCAWINRGKWGLNDSFNNFFNFFQISAIIKFFFGR